MMRATLASNSPHALMAVTASNGAAFQHRVTAGGSSVHVAGPTGTAPYQLGSKVWFVPKLDGVSQMMTLSVNGIVGGNATVGTVNEQNGEYKAPLTMP